MAEKSCRHIFAGDTVSIVCHTHKSDPTAAYFHCDGSRMCIYRIFSQLFYNRSGAFYNFTGRNQICNVLIKNMDFSHSKPLLSQLPYKQANHFPASLQSSKSVFMHSIGVSVSTSSVLSFPIISVSLGGVSVSCTGSSRLSSAAGFSA